MHLGRPHAAGDVHAFERGAGGGRSRLKAAVARQHHLAVGADVDEQGHARASGQIHAKNAGRDVGSDKSGDHGGKKTTPIGEIDSPTRRLAGAASGQRSGR